MPIGCIYIVSFIDIVFFWSHQVYYQIFYSFKSNIAIIWVGYRLWRTWHNPFMPVAAKSTRLFLVISLWLKNLWLNIWRNNVHQDTTNNSPRNIFWIYGWFQIYFQKSNYFCQRDLQAWMGFWKQSKPCHVGIHWKALAEHPQMSTQKLPMCQGLSHFSGIFASYSIDKISQ